LKGTLDRTFKQRQIAGYCSPNGIHVDGVVLLAKPVADPTDVAPWRARTNDLSPIAEPDGCIADHLQLAFDAATDFGSARNVCTSIPCVNCLIAAIASAISRNESDGSLKGTKGLALGPVGNRLFQGMRRREIDVSAKQVRKTVLKTHHVEQGKMLRAIEVGDQVNIGCCRCRASGERTVQAQMQNAGSLQLRRVVS
jgi:hypothetical protein